MSADTTQTSFPENLRRLQDAAAWSTTDTTLYVGGRRTGRTRATVKAIIHHVETNPGGRILVLAANYRQLQHLRDMLQEVSGWNLRGRVPNVIVPGDSVIFFDCLERSYYGSRVHVSAVFADGIDGHLADPPRDPSMSKKEYKKTVKGQRFNQFLFLAYLVTVHSEAFKFFVAGDEDLVKPFQKHFRGLFGRQRSIGIFQA